MANPALTPPLPSLFSMRWSIHPGPPDDPPRPRPRLLRPRVHPRPISRQAPARGPLPERLWSVTRGHGDRYDGLRGLDKRQVQERSQPACLPVYGCGEKPSLIAAAGGRRDDHGGRLGESDRAEAEIKNDRRLALRPGACG